MYGSFETFDAKRAANVIQSTLSTYLDDKFGELDTLNAEDTDSTWTLAGPLVIVVVTAGPPCQPLSSIRGPAAGRKEQVYESLFSATFDWIADLNGELNLGGESVYEIIPIIETIVPRCAETATAIEELAQKAEWEAHPAKCFLFSACDHKDWQQEGRCFTRARDSSTRGSTVSCRSLLRSRVWRSVSAATTRRSTRR